MRCQRTRGADDRRRGSQGEANSGLLFRAQELASAVARRHGSVADEAATVGAAAAAAAQAVTLRDEPLDEHRRRRPIAAAAAAAEPHAAPERRTIPRSAPRQIAATAALLASAAELPHRSRSDQPLQLPAKGALAAAALGHGRARSGADDREAPEAAPDDPEAAPAACATQELDGHCGGLP